MPSYKRHMLVIVVFTESYRISFSVKNHLNLAQIEVKTVMQGALFFLVINNKLTKGALLVVN